MTTGLGRRPTRHMIIAIALVTSGCAAGAHHGQARSAAPPTTAPSVASRLPTGPASSPYLVAHVLPAGYDLVSADDRQVPDYSATDAAHHELGPKSQLRNQLIHGTGYAPATGSDDELLTVFTIHRFPFGPQGRPTDAQATTVRGHPGWRLALTDEEDRTYGVQLTWLERPGLWVTIQAQHPLSTADAYRVATGLRPFPAARWHDLEVGTNQVRPLGPTEAAGDEPVEVGAGTAGGRPWTLTALIPPRWGRLLIERRPPCARLTYDGVTNPNVACADRDGGWIEFAHRLFEVGQVPSATTRVDVEVPGRSIRATIIRRHRSPPITYWVADLGPVRCEDVKVTVAAPGRRQTITGYLPIPGQDLACRGRTMATIPPGELPPDEGPTSSTPATADARATPNSAVVGLPPPR